LGKTLLWHYRAFRIISGKSFRKKLRVKARLDLALYFPPESSVSEQVGLANFKPCSFFAVVRLFTLTLLLFKFKGMIAPKPLEVDKLICIQH